MSLTAATVARAGMLPGFVNLTTALPTLALPRNTWTGGFTNSHLYDAKTKKETAKVPLADPIISEYGRLYLAVRFTVNFVEFINQKYLLYQLAFNNQRLDYALEVHRKLNNFSLLETDPNETQMRETVLFYLNNQIFIINIGNLERLRNYGESLAADYAEKLGKVEYTIGKERQKLSADQAASLLQTVRETVAAHLTEMFQKIGAQTSEKELPKPGEVELPVGVTTVTADLLLKINPAFTAARAADLAAPINRAMVSASIQNKIAQAMFLAQVIHEIGLNPNLEENGKNSTKMYNGKKYPYFFYMYDKDSPDPNKQAVAKAIGNTEAGDGDKFHGRGFLQLTGRWNFDAAGKYIGKDLTAQPELVSNIEIAALTSGWFWHKYRKINGLISAGTADEFSKVTVKINPPKEGYASRLAFWAKAKLALGIK